MSGVEETYVIRVKTRVSGVATAHKSLIFKGSFRHGASFSVRLSNVQTSNRKASFRASSCFEDLFLRRGKSQVGNMTTNIFSLLLEAKIQISELFTHSAEQRQLAEI